MIHTGKQIKRIERNQLIINIISSVILLSLVFAGFIYATGGLK